MRELRDNPEAIENLLIDIPGGNQLPLKQVAKINFETGPQMIKSEDTFLVSYVTFDKIASAAEVNVVMKAQSTISAAIDRGELKVPASVTYKFAGNYENQLRANKRLSVIVPLTLLAIFMILYFQFKKVNVSMMIFSGIAVAFSGGFIMLWLYNQQWFMNFDLFGNSIRDIFQIKPVNVSTAVWVGFIALFGIATDDGVLMAQYMEQNFGDKLPDSIDSIRKTTIEAAEKRLRPALMTSATTILALLPVLTSRGRGSDIMIPMAIPSFGGMLVALITLFVVPLLYSWYRENELKKEILSNENNDSHEE
jgi:Cu(I)/Ag(I) efflux system membrane protein CusA/SilA